MVLRPFEFTFAFVVVAVLWPISAQAHVLKQTENGALVHWEDGPIVLRVRESAGCGPDRASLIDAATIATDAWRGVSNAPDVVLEGGRPPSAWALDGENGIYVLCNWPFESELAVTVASYDDAGRMIDADVLLNGTQPLALLVEGGSDNTHYDLASVLTHELGHVLGLGESGARAATMWPTTMRGATSQRTLAPDDENGLIAIYGEPGAPEHVTYGCRAAPAGQSGRTPLVALLVAFVALTIAGRRGRAFRAR